MNPKSLISLVFSVVVLGGLSYAAWRYASEREAQSCKACSRPLHEHSQAVALVDGRRGS